MIVQRLYAKCKRILEKERCPERLAFSLCIGVYIAFSPFVGLHTAMVFFFSWLFTLNVALLFLVSCGINNPWTMIPIYATDHIFGDWLFSLFGINGMHWNPSWLMRFNTFVSTHTGLQGISLWSFIMGGNLLGLGISGLLYPILRRCLKKIRFSKSKVRGHEAYNQE